MFLKFAVDYDDWTVCVDIGYAGTKQIKAVIWSVWRHVSVSTVLMKSAADGNLVTIWKKQPSRAKYVSYRMMAGLRPRPRNCCSSSKWPMCISLNGFHCGWRRNVWWCRWSREVAWLSAVAMATLHHPSALPLLICVYGNILTGCRRKNTGAAKKQSMTEFHFAATVSGSWGAD